MKKISIRSGALLIAATALVSGCIVAPAPYHYQPVPVYRATAPAPYQAGNEVYPDSAPAPVVAYAAPPPAQEEMMGVAPAPGYFWISGVWLWEGGRHIWHPGHWNAPRAGFVWVPHAWHQVGNAWHLTGGHWNRR